MKTIQTARLSLFITITAIISLTIGCSKSNSYGNMSSSGSPGGTKSANEVWLQNSMFDPTTLFVPVNTTVKWTNQDSFAHTVTSDSTMFDSGNLSANGTFNYQFTTKGTFKYHCNYHSMMKGTVIVQ